MTDTSASFPFEEAFRNFTIDPRTNWSRFFNPQFFVAVNEQDAALENKVIGQVGSYGKQLSILIDVIAVLIGRLPDESVDVRDREVINRFKDLVNGVQQITGGQRRVPAVRRAVETLVPDLRALKTADPQMYDEIVRALRKEIDG
ncbi:MAG TPA: hypothetical protein VE196_13250 [Pseudonocardiaceae bacterium]|jgi:hypothetical protein|nr:hypothetical protein [Pseudonocardiaceae bacterium]